uniref:MPV17 mitochondrial inner membrane protein like n=1 Tax=Amphiprion ocellaris TaxID=80972 RepID=A0AAQ5ZCV6_AMPOC
MRKAFLRHVRRFPWVTNVTLYGCLFAGGDFVHQWFSRREKMDWSHTRNVAVVAFSFHGNFNFFWMRFLERRFPGNSYRMVLRKLLLDQTTAAPLATTVFYTGRWVVELTGMLSFCGNIEVLTSPKHPENIVGEMLVLFIIHPITGYSVIAGLENILKTYSECCIGNILLVS